MFILDISVCILLFDTQVLLAGITSILVGSLGLGRGCYFEKELTNNLHTKNFVIQLMPQDALFDMRAV